jgi:ABC-type uncharacterized transport system involved in gliding motility auxiliary subunit
MLMGNPRRFKGLALLALLAVAFAGSSVVFTTLLHGPRLDLTSDGMYTLSAGTRRLVAGLDEPVDLRFYYSREALRAEPLLATYGRRVREMLEEIAAASAGQVRLEVVDPEPYSDEEEQAAEAGLQALPLGPRGATVYFGLAGRNATGGSAAIEFFQPAKERLVEYDIARLIHQLSTPEKPRVGLMTTLPMTFGFDPTAQRMRQPWVIVSQLQQAFEVRNLEPDASTIPADLDVLMLVHPKLLPAATLYAIDQYVMNGGRLLLFLDPSAEQDLAGGDPTNPFGGDGRASELEPLLTAWGIRYRADQALGDDEYALTVSGGGQPMRHLGFLGLDERALEPADPVTGGLGMINLATTGWLQPLEGAGTSFTPLLTSSELAAPIPAARFAEPGEPSDLFEGFKPSGRHYALAARVAGKLPSAYPDGPPEGASLPPGATHQTQSGGESGLIVVADTDLLADQLWTRTPSYLGQTYVEAWADNGHFVMNALDNLAGSDALVSIRGRASFVRPFDRVEDLRRSADERLRATAAGLAEQLDATEQKLSALQSRRDDETSPLPTREQQAELERFRAERNRIARELREVQHSLDRDIDALGARVKLLNIVVLPVALVFLAWLVARRRRRAA